MGAALDKLRQGDFNIMVQEWQPDGSVIIELCRRGEPNRYRLQVVDLDLPTEQVLWEEEVPV